jgi:hypothetical protein
MDSRRFALEDIAAEEPWTYSTVLLKPRNVPLSEKWARIPRRRYSVEVVLK